MDVRHLIDSIVQRTMVLIAQLATTEGSRTPLVHVADQVFLELIKELEQQGVRKKVVADMFGLALRGYQRRVQRVVDGSADSGVTLRDSILAWLQDRDAVSRETLLTRFRHADDAVVKAIMADLVEQGLVFRAGAGSRAIYRAASSGEIELRSDPNTVELASIIWLTVYRYGPLTLEELAERHKRVAVDLIERLVGALVTEGRVTVHGDTTRSYSARHFLPNASADAPWAAAVSDHFDALITTLCRSISKDSAHPWSGSIGGSTYSFDLWPGHPYEEQVLRLLKVWRGEISKLRAEVTAFNDAHPPPEPSAVMRATLYFGENVVGQVVHDDRFVDESS